VTTLSLKQHDTAPTLTITCTDNGTPVDLTAAASVKVIGSLEGLVLFSDTATGDADGVVTRPWVAEDTDTAGTVLVEVEVTWPGGAVQTFPADGYLTVLILPDLG
jgi:hypothetical protein